MKSPLFPTLVLAAGLAGCAATSPDWDEQFGDAARMTRAAQVIDPAASSRKAPPASVDGKAAAGAVKAYAESYGYAVKEAKPPAVQLTNMSSR
jgi:hypothetical protein